MNMAFLRGLGKAPTFLVPIINPPFADNSPHNPPRGGCVLRFFYFSIFRNATLPGGWRPLGASLTPHGQGLRPCPNELSVPFSYLVF
jgi:hypothetical protein